MLEIALMIEGQNGLTWSRWQRIAKFTEDAGFAGLYRSDHFTNSNPPDIESLELWTSLTWLACNTKRIEFGPLVTPFSFRHPVHIARMASAVDDLSDGRLTLGLGAGWQEREHNLFGFDLLDIPSRFDRFKEGMEVVTHLLNSDSPVSFNGKFYGLNSATLLPRPQREGGPRISVGGNGKKVTLKIAAQYAHEWNANFISKETFSDLNTALDQFLKDSGRDPKSVRRTLMTGTMFAASDSQFNEKMRRDGTNLEGLREYNYIFGTPGMFKEQLQELESAGVERIMLQWLDLDDMDGLEALSKAVL